MLSLLAFSTQARIGLLDSLGIDDSPVVLPVEEAFVFSAKRTAPREITVHWKVIEGHYLYRDKMQFSLVDKGNMSIAGITLPAGKEKDDALFGLTEVFEQNIDAVVRLLGPAESQTVMLQVQYQGCSGIAHVCYPPVTERVEFELPETEILSATIATEAALEDFDSTNAAVPAQDRIAKLLNGGDLWTILAAFFGFGLLLAFTPCIFPMIPILSSIIVGQEKTLSARRGFILSGVYVLAMSLAYSAAGIATGLLGQNLQAAFQSPWILGGFSVLLVLFSLAMFGLFELQLPQVLQNKLNQLGQKQRGGSLVGAALMGVLSALIVGPCLAPPLAGALLFIGEQGDPVLGGLALFFLSLGMGLPLIAIGTSAGKLLPHAGGWMTQIKAVFGVLLLGLAISFLSRILPASLILALWAVLLIVSAVYLGVLSGLKSDATGWQKLIKGSSLTLLAYGLMLLVGAAKGNHNVWQPLALATNVIAAENSTSRSLAFEVVDDLAALKTALAADSTRPVLLDFYADWCVDCKKMEATTFRDPAVLAALAGFRLLKADVTANTAAHKSMQKELGVYGPPTMLFFSPQGNEYRANRLVGAASTEIFLQHLTKFPK